MLLRYRIKYNPTVPEHRLGIQAHVVAPQQTVAGCDRRAVSVKERLFVEAMRAVRITVVDQR